MKAGRLIGELRGGGVWKGLAAGAAGGLAASVAMNQFQALWSKLAGGRERSHGAQSMQQGSPQHGVGRELQRRGRDEGRDDAAMRLANAISVGLLDHELTRSEKEATGTAIHYAFGVMTGGVYGAAAELLPGITAGAGVPFGAFVWLSADEGVVPGLGLSKSPTEYPLSIHAYALASHLVYGLTTELVRRAVRQALR
jgi:putative membrane protein